MTKRMCSNHNGRRFSIFLGMMLLIIAGSLWAGKNEFKYRIVYDQSGISRWPDYVMDHMRTAAKAGYNGFVSCDWALENLENQPAKVFDSYKKAIALSKSLGIKMIPWHFYQAQPAHENPNLAEAFPVRGTPFVVSNGRAKAYSDPQIQFRNGGFESGNPIPTGWSSLGATPIIDTQFKHSGNASVKFTNPTQIAGLKQIVSGFKPFRAYELSVWIRTQKFSPGAFVKFHVIKGRFGILDNRDAGFGKWGINGNLPNFIKYKADFNSLDATTLDIRILATQKAATGSIWFDDVAIREVGLYETMRRKSCPITVKSQDGSIVYSEGKDYTVDPNCSTFDPKKSYYYEGHLLIPKSSSIKNGQKLKVDWYQFSNVETWASESDFCLPETWATLKDNLNRIDNLFGNSDAMYCNIDEWRVGGWSDNCEAFKFKTAGNFIARSWEGIECLLRKTNACRTIFTWNDMFDPNFNSWHEYCAMKGGTWQSWEGLSNDQIIVNWTKYRGWKYTEQSLLFFAGKDPKYPNVKARQLVNPLNTGDMGKFLEFIEKAERKGADGIEGIVWTTWTGNYSQMVPVANVCKNRNRWPTNPFPTSSCAPAKQCKGFDPSKYVSLKDMESKDQSLPAGSQTIWAKSSRSHGNMVRIDFSIPTETRVSLDAFDLSGRLVQTMINTQKDKGVHTVTWDTSLVPAGVYLLRLRANGAETFHRQIIL